jgi:hypothetical protein
VVFLQQLLAYLTNRLGKDQIRQFSLRDDLPDEVHQSRVNRQGAVRAPWLEGCHMEKGPKSLRQNRVVS